MTNNDLKRFVNRFEEHIEARLDRHELKLDAVQHDVNGCVREFGRLTQAVADQQARLDRHEQGHKNRAGLAALVGGLVVAAANFLLHIVRGD